MGRMQAVESIEVDRDCEAVFALLTDLDGMPAWRTNLESAAWADGEAPGVGVGNLTAVTRMAGSRFAWRCDVTAFEPPRRFGYVARDAKNRFEVTVEFRCEPAGSGCLLTMEGGGEIPGGRIGGMAAPLFVRSLRRENRTSLANFKRLAEAAAGDEEV